MTCTSRRVLLRSNPTCNMRTGPPSVTRSGSHRKRDPGGGPRLHGIQGYSEAFGTVDEVRSLDSGPALGEVPHPRTSAAVGEGGSPFEPGQGGLTFAQRRAAC